MLSTINFVKTGRKSPDVLANEDIDKILANIKKRVPKSRDTNIHRDVAIVLMLFRNGLRVSELCDIDLPDVDITNKMIKIKNKSNKKRIVHVTLECTKAILLYLQTERKSVNQALFVKTSGHRVTIKSISYMFLSLLNKTKLKHTIHHTLGRSNIKTTQTNLVVDNQKLMNVYKAYHPFGDDSEAM